MLFDESTSKDFIQRFEGKIRAKGMPSPPPCPLCSNAQWSVAPGYMVSPVQKEMGGLVLGGPTLPTIAIICNNCGFVAHIALGPLGLLPKAKAKAEVEHGGEES